MFPYPWHASSRAVKGYRSKSFPPDRLSPFSKSRFLSYYDTASVGGEDGNGLTKWSQSRPYNHIFISRQPRPVPACRQTGAGSFFTLWFFSLLERDFDQDRSAFL